VTDPTPASDAKSPWWLAFRVIDEPAQVFRALAARPTVMVPIILLVITAGIVAVGTPASTLRSRAERQAEMMEQRAPDRFTEDDRAQMLEDAAGTRNRLIIFAAGAVIGVIALMIVAAVLLLIFNAIGSQPVKFKDELAIATHAYMPQLLGAILMILLARFAAFDQPLSLGFLFREGFLHSLGQQITLFGVWNIILLALGNQIRAGLKGFGTPLAIVGGLWFVVILMFAGLGTAFGGAG
jgi:hypothetical protein